MNSLTTRTEFNFGRFPVVDRNGRPFTPDCRVRFRVLVHHLQFAEGEGIVTCFDEMGGAHLRADRPVSVYDDRGAKIGERRNIYSWVGEYFSGDSWRDRRRVTSVKVYDPLDGGSTECFLEVLEA